MACRDIGWGRVEFVEKDGREVGHLHGHGLLDVAVGRQAARLLVATGQVRRHHVFPRSKWVSFQIDSTADVPFALELLTMHVSYPPVTRVLDSQG